MKEEREESRGGGSESLKKYLKEISRLSRITAEEERFMSAAEISRLLTVRRRRAGVADLVRQDDRRGQIA